jgi:hypothetical protein
VFVLVEVVELVVLVAEFPLEFSAWNSRRASA